MAVTADCASAYLEIKRARDARKRQRRFFATGALIVAFIIAVAIGTVFYAMLFGLPWEYAFYEAALVLSEVSIDATTLTRSQAIFVVIYAFVSVVLLLSLADAIIEDFYGAFLEG